MSDTETTQPADGDATQSSVFEQQAEEDQLGLVAEFWDFLKHNKKWWLIPLIVCLLGLGALLIFAAAAGPGQVFIYTLF